VILRPSTVYAAESFAPLKRASLQNTAEIRRGIITETYAGPKREGYLGFTKWERKNNRGRRNSHVDKRIKESKNKRM
jgi:hypothetical protein